MTGLVGPSTLAHLEEDVRASDLVFPPAVARELDAFVLAEEARLARDLKAEIAAIVGRKITDVSEAPRLIYVLESLAELELAPEEDLIACFKQLLGVMHGGGDAGVLEEIRGRLVGYL